MNSPDDKVITSDDLPEGDIIKILLDQHADIRELLDRVSSSSGDSRATAFAHLRTLLAVHETAEEMILRPETTNASGKEVADARNDEEAEATEVLKELESMEVDTPAFSTKFEDFKASVSEHADKEEREEFPGILATCDEAKRASMGRSVHSVESMAPTHPHPTAAGKPAAQWAVGPFAAMVDRARDLLSKSPS